MGLGEIGVRTASRKDVGVDLENYGGQGCRREEDFLVIGDLADIAVERRVLVDVLITEQMP